MPAKTTQRARADAPVPDERFVEDYLLYLLARASHQASEQFHAVAKARGVSPVEWRVLAFLSDGPSTIGELAGVTLLQQPTLTKVVDRMQRDGLVARRPEPSDGRRVRVEVTARGRALAADLIPLAQRHEDQVLDGYSPAEARALKAALKKLIERTGRMRFPG
jgi:DNA-binding MarR family transcriptional regulator